MAVHEYCLILDGGIEGTFCALAIYETSSVYGLEGGGLAPDYLPQY